MQSTKAQWGKATFTIKPAKRPALINTAAGRVCWELECLMPAGDAGCTLIDTPGPRCASYIFELRRFGAAIEKLTESHSGPLMGTRARSVLRCAVGRVKKSGVAA